MSRKLNTFKRNLAMRRIANHAEVKQVAGSREQEVIPIAACAQPRFDAEDDAWERHCEIDTMFSKVDPSNTIRIHIDMHKCRCPIMQLIHKVPEDGSREHIVAIGLPPSAREAIFLSEEALFVDSVRLKGQEEIQRLSIPILSITRITWTDVGGRLHDRQLEKAWIDKLAPLFPKEVETFRWAKVLDPAAFETHVFGGSCFLNNFPEITKGGVRLRSNRHYGNDVWHVVDEHGNRYHDTSFFTEKEMQFLVDVPVKD